MNSSTAWRALLHSSHSLGFAWPTVNLVRRPHVASEPHDPRPNVDVDHLALLPHLLVNVLSRVDTEFLVYLVRETHTVFVTQGNRYIHVRFLTEGPTVTAVPHYGVLSVCVSKPDRLRPGHLMVIPVCAGRLDVHICVDQLDVCSREWHDFPLRTALPHAV